MVSVALRNAPRNTPRRCAPDPRLAASQALIHVSGVGLQLLSNPIPIDSVELPTEFRIFEAGWNKSTKGTFLFDAVAASNVMAAWREYGVDLIVDLNHESILSPDARSDSSDARGNFTPELRGGELWATNVTWTEDGADRIRSRKQRFISPAFDTDESGRIAWLWNVALVSMPATHKAPALVAASLVALTNRPQSPAARAAQYIAQVKARKHGS